MCLFHFWGYQKIKMNMTNYRAIPPIHCHESTWKLHIWPVSRGQIGAKTRKTNRPWPKYNQYQRWSGYISMSNFKLFLPCGVKKIPELPHLTRFAKSKWCQNEENQQTVATMYSVLKVVRIHQHVQFEAIPPLCSQEKARKSLILVFFTMSKCHQNEENEQTVTKI